MKIINKSLPVWALLIPMLAACGGGGGGGSTVADGSGSGSGSGGGSGGGSSGSPPSLSSIPWPVNSAAARQAVSGSMAPTQTVTQATQNLDTILGNADALDVGDLLAFIMPSSSGLRIPATSCTATTCTYTFQGETFEVSLDTSASPNSSFDMTEFQPVMTHNGVSIGQVRARDDVGTDDQFEYQRYGGWMEYSAFVLELAYSPRYSDYEFLGIAPYSYGDSPGTNPSAVAGRTATWTGAVVGVDYSISHWGNSIHGTATVDVDFAGSDVDVNFSNLIDLDETSRTIANMGWNNISLANGAFSRGTGSNQVKGRFYGPNHEEVGGIFDRNQITGAFGAIRGTR